MDATTNNDQRNDIIMSLCKLDDLITQTSKHRVLYARAKMDVFSMLYDTFEERLKEFDANKVS